MMGGIIFVGMDYRMGRVMGNTDAAASSSSSSSLTVCEGGGVNRAE